LEGTLSISRPKFQAFSFLKTKDIQCFHAMGIQWLSGYAALKAFYSRFIHICRKAHPFASYQYLNGRDESISSVISTRQVSHQVGE
jgi:hypothetical protein